jgi:alpha-mannosidase
MKKSPIGKYSGNKRLDPSILNEPLQDNDYSKKMWLEDVAEDEDFYDDAKSELDSWKKLVAQTANPEKLDIHIVGQSHIDMAWKWRYEQTRQKDIITFEKAIMHAKKFPGQFCYAASEPVLIQWLIEDAPKVYSELKSVIQSGGVELVGGSWVEPDCMMPSGEAFVRQRLYGMKFYNDHFGILPKVEWFLDSFGYNYGLPQILKKSGAEYFWTSKITWNRQTIFPFVNFWWKSPDGTKLLTANFQQNWAPLNSWIRFEIGRHPIKEGGKIEWDYRDDYENIDEEIDDDPENIIPPVGIFFGKGDGGHGPTHQEVAFAQAAVKSGWVKWSTAENFFKALEQYGEKLPVWNDELYLEYHRGTFSVHFEVKRHNRYFEHKLVALENIASILSLTNPEYKYPQKLLETTWKIVLLNQFHDVLPGSSIPEVYDDVFDMWAECNENIGLMIQELTKSMALPEGSQLVISNPLSWKRTSPAFIPLSALTPVPALDSAGKPPYLRLIDQNEPSKVIYAQPVAAEKGTLDDTRPAGWWVVITLHSLESKAYKLELAGDGFKIPDTVFIATETTVNGPNLKVVLDPKTGALLELTAAGLHGGKNLLKGTQSNLTVGFLDDYPQDHAWNIKPEYWKFPLKISNDTNVNIKVADNGPVFTTLKISRTLGEGPIREKLAANEPIGENKVTQKVTLFRDCPALYLTYEADWQQPWLMLKVIYETATEAVNTVSDQSYCAIKRSTVPKSRPDWARYEKIMHNYADLSTAGDEWGIALLNEGKYAYDANGGTMRLTMLRTPEYPTTAAEAWANLERQSRLDGGEGTPPRFADLGFLRCRYALLPHEGGALRKKDGAPNAVVKRAAEEFNIPLVVLPISEATRSNSQLLKPISDISALKCSPEHVLVSSIKQKEWVESKSFIIRIVESSGVKCDKVSIQLAPELAAKIARIIPCDLLERPVEKDFHWDSHAALLATAIGPFEILSFELNVE